MIQINDIVIPPKGEKLIIDAEIIGDSAYVDCYIKKVYIDTQDTYLTSGPSEDTVYSHNVAETDAKDTQNATIEINNEVKVRKLHLEIPQESICASLQNNMFIVYIEGDGVIDGQPADCCSTDTIVLGSVIWMKPIYNQFLVWNREINKECEIPKNFIYTYLQYQSFIVAVRTANILEAIKIYNKFLRKNNSLCGVPKGCNCH